MTTRDDRIIEAWRNYDEETFIRELSLNSIESAFRPRDEFDVELPPDSLRATVLAYHDELAKVRRQVEAMPWYKRWLGRLLLRRYGL